MVLINGRMSHRSFPALAQGQRHDLGAAWPVRCLPGAIPGRRGALCRARQPQCRHHGQSETDVPAPPADPGKLERLMSMTRGRPVIVAASTHPGEEEILLEAHRRLAGFFPTLLSVIVPRHPDRGEAIARAITAAGLHVGLRSREELPTATTDIYVADTMGELGLFYRLAPIVFMEDRWSSGAARIRSRRSSSAPRSFTDLTSSISPMSTRRSTARAAPSALTRRMRWSSSWPVAGRSGGAQSVDRGGRTGGVAARRRARSHADRARALSVAIAARDGGVRCMSRPFGTGLHHGCHDCCCHSAPSTA